MNVRLLMVLFVSGFVLFQSTASSEDERLRDDDELQSREDAFADARVDDYDLQRSDDEEEDDRDEILGAIQEENRLRQNSDEEDEHERQREESIDDLMEEGTLGFYNEEDDDLQPSRERNNLWGRRISHRGYRVQTVNLPPAELERRALDEAKKELLERPESRALFVNGVHVANAAVAPVPRGLPVQSRRSEPVAQGRTVQRSQHIPVTRRRRRQRRSSYSAALKMWR